MVCRFRKDGKDGKEWTTGTTRTRAAIGCGDFRIAVFNYSSMTI